MRSVFLTATLVSAAVLLVSGPDLQPGDCITALVEGEATIHPSGVVRELSRKSPVSPQRSSSTVIPMGFERNQILIDVFVNGNGPFLMLLDTGTDPSVFDLTFAKQLGLPIEPIRRPGVGAGTEEIVGYKTDVREITVGSLTIDNVLAVSVDMSKAVQRLGRDLKGVLGYSFLQGRIVQIDYPQRRVRFLDSPVEPRASCEHFKTPMQSNPTQSIPVIDGLQINGKPIRAALDSGSSLSVMILPKAIEFLGLSSDVQRASPSTAVGYGGQVDLREGFVQSMSLGSLAIENKGVTFAVRGMKEEALSMRGASIGNGLLQNFIVTFDYRDNIVVFERACAQQD